jgi:hypothetical protein
MKPECSRREEGCGLRGSRAANVERWWEGRGRFQCFVIGIYTVICVRRRTGIGTPCTARGLAHRAPHGDWDTVHRTGKSCTLCIVHKLVG